MPDPLFDVGTPSPGSDCIVLRTNFNQGNGPFEDLGFRVLDADIDTLFSRVSSPEMIRPADIGSYAREVVPDTNGIYVWDGRSLFSVDYVEQHYFDTANREDNPSRMAWYTSGSFYLETDSCRQQDIADRLGIASAVIYRSASPEPTFESLATPTASVSTAFQQDYSVKTTPDWITPAIISGIVLVVGLYLILWNKRGRRPL